MEQNIIAVVWDYDKTLVDGYMQRPLFEKYGVDEQVFWREVEGLKRAYQEKGIRINEETAYLNHLITCTKQGIFKGLNNAVLYGLGKQLLFYPGVPEVFGALRRAISDNADYKTFDIRVEHYVVSTGLAQMIRGSAVYPHIDGVWGCELIEQPVPSKLGGEAISGSNEFTQIGYTIDHTTKTRALFEINKGSNKYDINVNAKMLEKDRRIPFDQMIYVADGPSDVPAFSVVTGNGGKALAVYPKGDKSGLKQVNKLLNDGRVNMLGEADYREGTTTYLWLVEQIDQAARRIFDMKKRQIESSVSQAPKHLD